MIRGKLGSVLTYRYWAVLATLVVALAPSTVQAVDERKADVQILNKTGHDIEFVTVAHKYSDNYKESKTWGNLANGMASKDTLEVQYHTGFGTTGQDWWLITWRYKGDPTIYMTAPKNFREIVDAVEKLAITALPAAGKLVGSLVGGEPGGEIGGPAAKAMGSAVLNAESTVGFKSHILRKEDAKPAKATVIEINADKVVFRSPSGTEDTGVGKMEAKK